MLVLQSAGSAVAGTIVEIRSLETPRSLSALSTRDGRHELHDFLSGRCSVRVLGGHPLRELTARELSPVPGRKARLDLEVEL